MRSARDILFDGPDLTVYAFGRGSTPLFITFNNYVHESKRPSPFGARFLVKRGYSAICFVSKRANWSQSSDLAAAVDTVRASRLFREAGDRVAYGTSMGGFAALLLAGELGCSRALVGAPQVSIYPPLVPFDTRFATEAAGIDFLRPDARDGLSDACRYYVVYDPFHSDDPAHIAMLGRRRNVIAGAAPFTGHLVLATLLQMGVLNQMVLDFAADRLDLPALLREAHRNRRQSPDYIVNLAKACARRCRPVTAAHIAARALALAPSSFGTYRLVARYCRDAQQFGLLAEASRQYLSHHPDYREARRNLAIASLQLSCLDEAAALTAALCDDGAQAADWLLHSRLLIRQKDMQGALAACEAGLAAFPGDTRLEENRRAIAARL